MSKSVVRTVKNVTKGYSTVQVKVRNATSNDAWGPTGAEMSEIAQMTFSSSSDFYEIMDMLDKRLNDKGKNWRHVLKSLKVLDYCLHEGSELVVTWARKNIYIIKTLREFQYIDEDNRDVGLNVRNSAKELSSLIVDEDRLRLERHDRKSWKSRVTGLDEYGPMTGTHGMGSDPAASRRKDRRTKTNDDEDVEYRLALEASKNEAEEEQKRRSKPNAPSADDDDLARAIKLSKEEEEARRRELENANTGSLLDDTPVQQPQATGWNQGYQQQSAVDWFGNPVEQQQQPQSTGYLNSMYSQPTGMQPQQTGFQNGYGYNPYQQQQQTGYDQSHFQQQQQQQPQYLQPQQTAFSMNNPYTSQVNTFDQQSPQPEPLNAGSNNPWASTGNQSSLAPQPTGSNNPFASQPTSSYTRPQPTSHRPPTLNTLQEQKTATQFSSFPSSFSSHPQEHPQKEVDPHAARLNALLAAGEGQDTFGNVGNMRIPAQHTAPGTFVNSAGSTLGRLQPMQTGTNPFMGSQFTGMQGQQQQQQHLMPAQTGPGGFSGGGYGTAFGSQGGRQGGQGSGSLIDF